MTNNKIILVSGVTGFGLQVIAAYLFLVYVVSTFGMPSTIPESFNILMSIAENIKGISGSLRYPFNVLSKGGPLFTFLLALLIPMFIVNIPSIVGYITFHILTGLHNFYTAHVTE